MKQTIGACVVTYNRKDLLIRCLNAILRQEYLPDGIVIVDNVSTDSTFEEITTRMFPGLIFRYENESGFVYEGDIIVANRSMSVVYIQKKVNDGGSGGFYAAMKEAFNRGYDWLWLMDDDGLPDRKELKELYNKSVEYHLQYANALVLDIKDPTHFSFGLSKGRLVYTVEDAKKKPVIEDVANPFNGTFVSREVIEKIGFIKKEMFIRGDEIEYFLRTKKNRFKIATVPSAVHLHPKSVNKNNYISFYNWKVPDVFGTRFICVHRNKGYIYSRYYGICGIIKYLIANTAIYVCNFQFKKWLLFIKYYFEGVFNYYK